MITNTRSHSKILDNCFIVGQDKVQDVFHTSLSTASLTIRWRPCFSRNSNGFLAGEKGADVIELLLQSKLGMLKSPVSMVLSPLILWPFLIEKHQVLLNFRHFHLDSNVSIVKDRWTCIWHWVQIILQFVLRWCLCVTSKSFLIS